MLLVLPMGDIDVMRQYEFSIRIAQIHHLLDEHKYKKALAVVRTIDLKQVKNLSDLSVIADVFAKTEQFDSAKEVYLKIYNKSKTRRILYRLIYISIRTKEIDEAEDYYQEFIQMNPSMRDIITTRYRIDKAAGVPIGKLIETLEELKEEEYIEEWAYELAKLYHKAGRFEECRRECEDIKLWFGHGEIVERAQKLIDVINDKEAMPYFDDKDYTLDTGEPNPDDTGSLPGLNEYLQRKPPKDEKQLDVAISEEKKPVKNITEQEQEMEWIESKEPVNKQSKILNNDRNDEDMHEPNDFIDDYDEDDFDMDAGLGKLAKKLTGFFKFGSRKNNNNDNQEENVKSEHDITSNIKDDLNIKISINDELYNKTLENKKYTDKEDILDDDDTQKNSDNETSSETVNVYSQSGMGITQDLSREISAIYEAEHEEQIKKKETQEVSNNSNRPIKRDVTKVIERMAKAVKSDENKNVQSTNEEMKDPEEKIQQIVHEESNLIEKTKVKESQEKAMEEDLKAKEEEARAIVEEARKKAEEAARILAEAERKSAEAKAVVLANSKEKITINEDKEYKTKDILVEDNSEKKEIENDWSDDKSEDNGWYEDENYDDGFYDDAKYEDEEDILDFDSKGLSDADLPTTRALHTSFDDILTLIGGEQDPSHFVFVGNSSNLIVGLSKRIVKVMKETGYMSIGRIAKISAKKLNQMNLNGFKSQLKGNCLLIDEAAELMVPTIASVFEIMDEFYGDFVVILADDGNTLDQLFKFAPALARRFKYIIDISGYTEADCK